MGDPQNAQQHPQTSTQEKGKKATAQTGKGSRAEMADDTRLVPSQGRITGMEDDTRLVPSQNTITTIQHTGEAIPQQNGEAEVKHVDNQLQLAATTTHSQNCAQAQDNLILEDKVSYRHEKLETERCTQVAENLKGRPSEVQMQKTRRQKNQKISTGQQIQRQKNLRTSTWQQTEKNQNQKHRMGNNPSRGPNRPRKTSEEK